MLARRIVLSCVLVGFFASPLHAQSIDRTVLQQAARFAANQAQSNNAKVDWETRVQQAKRRQTGARNLLIAGAAGVGVGMFSLTRGSCDGGVWDCPALTVGTIGLIGGATVATMGLLKWRGASDDLDLLDGEGRAKGFVAMVPLPKGVMATIAWTF